MKIELKHIVGYLPYAVESRDNSNSIYRHTLTIDNYHLFIGKYSNKLIIRPTSDLAKEIESNGEKFVPIIELCKIAYDYLDIDKLTTQLDSANGAHTVMLNSILSLSFDSNDSSFIAINKGRTVSVPNQLKLFEKLYEWRFDIHGLIEKGLAIDINTLK